MDGFTKKPGYRLQARRLHRRAETSRRLWNRSTCSGADTALVILFEDSHLMVVNKRPRAWWSIRHRGMLRAPWSMRCFYHCTDLTGIGGELRPGIVHRLDKDTSGTMVVAKTEPVLNHLSVHSLKNGPWKKLTWRWSVGMSKKIPEKFSCPSGVIR